MSSNQNGYALVSMTNNDVYYINKKTAELVMDMLENGDNLGFVQFVDTKSGARVSISLSNVSSIVVKDNQNA